MVQMMEHKAVIEELLQPQGSPLKQSSITVMDMPELDICTGCQPCIHFTSLHYLEVPYSGVTIYVSVPNGV